MAAGAGQEVERQRQAMERQREEVDTLRVVHQLAVKQAEDVAAEQARAFEAGTEDKLAQLRAAHDAAMRKVEQAAAAREAEVDGAQSM